MLKTAQKRITPEDACKFLDMCIEASAKYALASAPPQRPMDPRVTDCMRLERDGLRDNLRRFIVAAAEEVPVMVDDTIIKALDDLIWHVREAERTTPENGFSRADRCTKDRDVSQHYRQVIYMLRRGVKQTHCTEYTEDEDLYGSNPTMTMLEKYAGQAMAGLLKNNPDFTPETLAYNAFRYAQAMCEVAVVQEK